MDMRDTGSPILLGLFLLLACAESGPSTAANPFPPNYGVRSVAVSPTARVIAVGDSLQFSASPSSANFPVSGYLWTVSPSAVATIDTGGLLRALSQGSVTVVACTTPTTAVCGSASLTIR